MTDPTCDHHAARAAELALGVLDGRDRAEVLAHVEGCAVCREDLDRMADVADRLAELTPSAEPPAGFETRVLASLAAQQGERAPHGPSGLGRLPAARVLAAAAVVVAVAVGGWVIGHRSAGSGDAPVAAAPLLGTRGAVGQAVLYRGGHPWIAMTVATGLGDQHVTCRVRESDGTTVDVGSFALFHGYGYWDADLPASATRITGASLVDAGGHTVATARFVTS